jgi:hypothetical protein
MLYLTVFNRLYAELEKSFSKISDFENLTFANFDIEVEVCNKIYVADFSIKDKVVEVVVGKYEKQKKVWTRTEMESEHKDFLELCLELSFPLLFEDVYMTEKRLEAEANKADIDELLWRETMRSLQFFR